MFDKRLRSTIREFKMIEKNDRVAIGLSGGKDSTVLLHCLHELKNDLPFELIAITVDEGIDKYRDATLKIAKAETKRLGIELKVVSFKEKFNKTLDTMLKSDPSRSCTYCGVLRRGLLNRAARELGATKLAIGHNLDDLAQTFLMNIIRAECSRISRYIDPPSRDKSFVPRIKPMLRTPEKEIAIYAMIQNIDIDHRQCPYADFALRQSVRRQLNELEEEYPGTKFKILSSFLEMQRALPGNYKSQNAKLGVCSSCKDPTSSKISREQSSRALDETRVSSRCKFCELAGSIK
jgi:uncharacterized protein (TIGR00269 family)